ncbi:MAG: MBL fold metallo-hydrolase [Dehalococcoidia bacterium]|nr:MBL fold metallo-hydrolase [Dehalococcoidia bacterium]
MAITVTILYDNEVLDKRLRSDWGFSALIDDDGGRVLFDAGADGDILLHNAAIIGEDLSTVSAVVLSHWHADHAGGLASVAALAPHATYFVPFNPGVKWTDVVLRQVREEPMQITAHVHSTGVVSGIEQALVVTSVSCSLLMTGCAHPGVRALIDAARKVAKPTCLLGGLHGFSEFSLLDDLAEVYPCHCTQRKREILARFKDKAHACGAGLRIVV